MTTTATVAAPAKSFIQIHTLHSYPAGLLNRDDAGAAKRIMFGSASRIRISSQSIKKKWRTAAEEIGLGHVAQNAVRSRFTFEHGIVEPLLAKGVGLDVARAIGQTLLDAVSGSSAEAKAKKKKVPEVKSNEVLTIGRGELALLAAIAEEASRTTKAEEAAEKALQLLTPERRAELKRRSAENVGVDAALFGRMTLGDVLAHYDASVHVAHPFSVTAENTEQDYFTAVDELATEMDVAASGMLGSSELTANIFYGHVVVDLPQLVHNLTGADPTLWTGADLTSAKQVVRALITGIATVSAGAKKGSTAPYTYADMLMVEIGAAMPCTHANAFLEPVPPRGDVLAQASVRLARRAADIDRVYQSRSLPVLRRFTGSDKTEAVTGGAKPILPESSRVGSMQDLLDWLDTEIGR